ncbi:MAG: chorismate synthase [Clostridiales bacterium]|nr:chorismate synthase [Clostridiales bacterium]
MDTAGNRIKLGLFGASHAECVGFTLSGLGEGFAIDFDELRRGLIRRSAASHPFATGRHEADDLIIESGLDNGVTTGETIRFSFPNRAHRSGDYGLIARPSHADYAAFMKYGAAADIAGGGKFSGRMTLPLTAAGEICRQYLRRYGVEVFAHVLAIGGLRDERFDPVSPKIPEGDGLFPLLNEGMRGPMLALIEKTREAGDTLSCEAECAVTGVPAGVGEPLFDGVEGTLSRLLFMIPGLRGVDFGDIMEYGSETNDQFTEGGNTATNRSGGVNGGMANGMPIVFRARFRPVPSIGLPQTGFDLTEKKPVPLTISGRHDTCILPRGLAAVEAAAAIGILDLILMGE